jgi:hypothetical protein
MNERIRELAEQATECYSNGQERTFDKEKFAELIVQECAKICIEQNVSNLDLDVIRESGKFTLQDLATKSCGENLSNQIKQHFGVEDRAVPILSDDEQALFAGIASSKLFTIAGAKKQFGVEE